MNIELNTHMTRINELAKFAKDQQVAHQSATDHRFDGRHLTLNGRRLLNFASCSYLGLAADPRLIAGASEYAERYGCSFPTSRSFVTATYLEELESKLEALFGYPCLVASSTSLGHIGFMPVVISKTDAIIADHQVHTSVSTAAQLIKAQGATLDVVRHNDMQALEEKIIGHSSNHNKIWYLADGIYSMYGDKAPIAELIALMDKYEQFHVYIDDAHGISWMGERGKGFVLDQAPLHPKMALITSLGKGFGSLGGVVVCQNQENKQIVKRCGAPFIFSSPLPATAVGPSIVAADIHLTDEIYTIQQELKQKVDFFTQRALELGLPLIDNDGTPIFFIASGNPTTCFELSKRMIDLGFYQSSAVFPSVPFNNGGVRFTITNWHTQQDMEALLQVLSKERGQILDKAGISNEKIKKSFKGVQFYSNFKHSIA